MPTEPQDSADDKLDESLEMTFPASDPVASVPPPRREAAQPASPSPAAPVPESATAPFSAGVAGKPGDEVPEGTAGSGEGVCRTCGGTRQLGDQAGKPCPDCLGTGKVNVGVGGA